MTSSEPILERLLDGLQRGDETAAAQLFNTYEPYLRMVVRRQLSAPLRSKFDSVDIVQSVWADVLDGFRSARWQFSDGSHLQAFLVQSARNRFIDRLRQHRTALEREQPITANDGSDRLDSLASGGTRPSEEVRADELWEKMLDLCPPTHHELLKLKRQGLSLNEIANQTGLHPSSVRRILYDLARKLAEQSP